MILHFLLFSLYTFCSPNVRTDGTVGVSVGVTSSQEKKTKPSDKLVSVLWVFLCVLHAFVSIYCNSAVFFFFFFFRLSTAPGLSIVPKSFWIVRPSKSWKQHLKCTSRAVQIVFIIEKQLNSNTIILSTCLFFLHSRHVKTLQLLCEVSHSYIH